VRAQQTDDDEGDDDASKDGSRLPRNSKYELIYVKKFL
jgi:hypothetical protein